MSNHIEKMLERYREGVVKKAGTVYYTIKTRRVW
jgi:hypothetical protein